MIYFIHYFFLIKIQVPWKFRAHQSCSLLYIQGYKQCLAYDTYSIIICWINEYVKRNYRALCFALWGSLMDFKFRSVFFPLIMLILQSFLQVARLNSLHEILPVFHLWKGSTFFPILFLKYDLQHRTQYVFSLQYGYMHAVLQVQWPKRFSEAVGLFQFYPQEYNWLSLALCCVMLFIWINFQLFQCVWVSGLCGPYVFKLLARSLF